MDFVRVGNLEKDYWSRWTSKLWSEKQEQSRRANLCRRCNSLWVEKVVHQN